MRRILLHAALFLLLSVPPAALLSHLSSRYPRTYPEARAIHLIERIREQPERAEVLVVGSSHARALDFEALGVEGFDLGLPWNDLREVEFQIRTLAPELPRLHTVFLALSFFSFHWGNEHTSDEQYLFSRRVYYATVPTLHWMPGDFSNYVRGRTYWLARSDNWSTVVENLLGKDRLPESRRDYYDRRTEWHSAEDLHRHAQRRVFDILEPKREMLANRPNLPEENYATLSSIVEYLRERGVRVILFTPPYSVPYRTLYERESGTLEEMRRLTRRLQDEHGVEWYDFSEHGMSADPAFFLDSDHLNYRGRTRFTTELQQAIGAVRPLDP